jgi:hypothetical protein
MDFGEVLSKAWKITWKFKVLWIFGILASCGTRSGGNYNSGGSSNYRTGGLPGETPNLPPGFVSGMEQVLRFFENPAVIAVFLSVICIIILLTIFLGTIGQIGLIKGVTEVDEGAETLTFGGLWSRSLPFFWRVFWLSVLVGLPFLIIFFIMAIGFVVALIPIMNNNSAGAGAAFLALLPVLCVLFCVVFLLAIVVGFIVRMAENAIVVENKPILGAFQRGWDVLVKNLGPILIIWLISAAISFVAGIVIALPIIIVLVPIFITFFASGFTGNVSYTPLIIAGLCIVAYIPISLVANGVLTTYIQSIWTLTYLRLTKPKPIEPIPTALPANA